ncbi:GMCbeta2 [Operophtera brumata]|uniref:GMCbeta2 n=1 Tax=Operophtera brumata TaxID=104452 RepID=A0A0L7KNL7_OPEBR|nr:GMCbeta2 [Operophtera brumata]
MNTENDWVYKTQPQEGACRGYKNKRCAWPRGKTLGGSSSINAMFYVRGNKLDYDEWAASGNNGWSYEEVLPYFKKSEKLSQYTEEHSKFHGTNGYLSVENEETIDDLENMVIKGAVELGMKNSTDINGVDQMGIIKSYTTTRNGVRCSTARAFLSPLRDRKNLHVIKNAHATKLVFKTGTNQIIGVLLKQNGKEIFVRAMKEVVVSSGAINSPQLLMLSGIGPQKHLEKLGIEVKADLPVGENLQDHLFVPIFYTAPGDSKLASLPNIAGVFAQYMFKHEGPLAGISPHRVISFWNTTDSQASSPDIQNHYLIFPAGINNMINLFEKHDFSDEIQQKFELMNKDQFTMIVYNVLLKPKSRGKIILKSKNPMDKPLIYANYFDNLDDMKTVIRGIRQFSLKLGETKALKEARFKLDWLEIDACKKHERDGDDFLECIARELTFSLYHPVGTVKMGAPNDKSAVVDPELRVKTVEGLRVVDASIMPSIVRGNTNAPSIMIGEKGADMIIKHWLRHTEL